MQDKVTVDQLKQAAIRLQKQITDYGAYGNFQQFLDAGFKTLLYASIKYMVCGDPDNLVTIQAICEELKYGWDEHKNETN